MMNKRRMVVLCEFSGVVREAFAKLGWDAWSVDLLPTEIPGQHIQGDALEVLGEGWDLAICHPPCQYLANSGARWLYIDGDRNEARWALMAYAAEFFNALLNAPINHIAVENPIQHKHARQLITTPYTQIIQPYMFGHGESKATCLWLKNLPKLQPTNQVEGRVGRVHHEAPSVDRWKNRSRTLQGIGDAMASQWTLAFDNVSSQGIIDTNNKEE